MQEKMRLYNGNSFKIGNLTLFLFLFLFQPFSYGETESSLSENQSSEQQTFSEELPREENNYSIQTKSSQLSLKGELLVGTSLFFFGIIPIIPISLEFETPTGMKNEKLSWLILAGGGITFPGMTPYLSLDVGLRYDFQPLILSLTLGGGITSSFLESITDKEETDYAVSPILIPIKWALSIGRKLQNETQIALTVGSFATIYSPFLGLSASIPLKKW